MTKKEKSMAVPARQILLCQSFRAKGDAKGICHKQTDGFLQYIEEEILDRGLDMQIVATGCLKQCESGPIMVVQPDNLWFKGIDSEAAIDAVLDGIEEGNHAEEYLLK
jgi:(2Fe-2S) ferredoxin